MADCEEVGVFKSPKPAEEEAAWAGAAGVGWVTTWEGLVKGSWVEGEAGTDAGALVEPLPTPKIKYSEAAKTTIITPSPPKSNFLGNLCFGSSGVTDSGIGEGGTTRVSEFETGGA